MANTYFDKMNKARKEGAKSFTHNDKTYVSAKTKTGMVIYKQKKNVFAHCLLVNVSNLY